MCRHIWLPPGPFRFPVGRVPGYRACRKEHVLPIVRDEFRPVIPRRGARQRCPSPLHRHHQIKAIAASKGIIYHRTVTPLLTGCFSPGDKLSRSLNQRDRIMPLDKIEEHAFVFGKHMKLYLPSHFYSRAAPVSCSFLWNQGITCNRPPQSEYTGASAVEARAPAPWSARRQ